MQTLIERLQAATPDPATRARCRVLSSLVGLICLLCASPSHGQPLFSLEEGTPTLIQFGLSAADLFVDDTVPGGPPELALPGTGLGLPAGANLDALSSGRENAGLAWRDLLPGLPVDNPLNSERIFYFFSVDGGSVDQVPPGRHPIPHFPPNLGPTLSSTNAFAGAFGVGDHAGSIFQNEGSEVMRSNNLFIDRPTLDLLAGDDLDALADLATFGGVLDRRNTDGEPGADGILDEGVTVLFSVAPGAGLDPAAVYQVTGSGPLTLFATAAELGLSNGDDIDALCVFDDLVAFSLRAGSASLPVTFADDPNGVEINQGGLLLARVGHGLLSGLPESYFGLQTTDELNALHCVDPDPVDDTTCDTEDALTQMDGVSLMPRMLDLEGGASRSVVVSLPTSQRGPVDVGVHGYKVVATVEDPSVARVIETSVVHCGADGPGESCFDCGLEDGPGDGEVPCAGESGSLTVLDLEPPLLGRDLCLGEITVEGVGPGATHLVVEASVFGPSGEVLETVAQRALILWMGPCDGG